METVTTSNSDTVHYRRRNFLEFGALEVAYVKDQGRVNAIIGHEQARLLHVRALRSEETNACLQLCLEQQHSQVFDLERHIDKVTRRNRFREEKMRRLEETFASKCRDVQNLKVELDSARSVSMESARLLTEKLALSRELSGLKPEVEHLRAECASREHLLGEKLSLQRELNALRVELETEKRSLKRLLSQDDRKAAVEARLQSVIEAHQVQLGEERRARQRCENEARILRIDLEGQRTLMDSKVEGLRDRLKATREQLRDTQASLEATCADPKAQMFKTRGTSTKNVRKRTLRECDEDTKLGTPGEGMAAKRLKRGSTAPGDKSHFSITPFLNRTTSMAPETPPSRDHENPGTEQRAPTSATTILPPFKGTEQANTKINVPIMGHTHDSHNTVSKTRQGIISKLTRVSEEESEGLTAGTVLDKDATKVEDLEDNRDVAKNKEKTATAGHQKKRKILGPTVGKTIFDEDDGNAGQTSHSRRLGPVGLKRVPLPSKWTKSGTQFVGAFSPLKRDLAK